MHIGCDNIANYFKILITTKYVEWDWKPFFYLMVFFSRFKTWVHWEVWKASQWSYTSWQWPALHHGILTDRPVGERRGDDITIITIIRVLYFLESRTTVYKKQKRVFQIVMSLVNGRPGSKNFTYSPLLQDFTKATNIRLRFLRTNTLLGHLISKAQRDPTVTRRVRHTYCDLTQKCFVPYLCKQLCTTFTLASFLQIQALWLLLLTHSSLTRPYARTVSPVISVI